MPRIQSALLRPLGPLVRLYLKQQSRMHMEGSFRCILLEEHHKARAHWSRAETFRAAAESLASPQTPPTPPARLPATRVALEDTP